MTSRVPLYYDSGSIREFTADEITEYVTQTIFQYGSAPTSVLTVVSSNGAGIAALSDTRTQAGAASNSDGNESGTVAAADFVIESSTAEPATVTVAYDKINLAHTSITVQADTNSIKFPVYYDGSGGIRSMSQTDFLDTFGKPAIDLLVAGTESASTAGTYSISTSATATNYTEVSDGSGGTAIFLDTRANVGAYAASGIPETLDQPTTITSYYLHRRNPVDNSPSKDMLYIDGDSNLKEFTEGEIEALLANGVRHLASDASAGYKIGYSMATSGTGSTRGSAVVNTKLDGSGNYQTRNVGSGSNQYRSQEFPNGTAQTITTSNLRITKS